MVDRKSRLLSEILESSDRVTIIVSAYLFASCSKNTMSSSSAAHGTTSPLGCLGKGRDVLGGEQEWPSGGGLLYIPSCVAVFPSCYSSPHSTTLLEATQLSLPPHPTIILEALPLSLPPSRVALFPLPLCRSRSSISSSFRCFEPESQFFSAGTPIWR